MMTAHRLDSPRSTGTVCEGIAGPAATQQTDIRVLHG